MRCSEIMNQLEELSPVQFADSWDNVGLLVGRNDKNVKKVCIALDPTDEVIEQAILYEADMLITHHPLIFNGMKTITTNHFIGNRIYQLIQNDICYYAMHTNFDVMGMADAAADELGMKQSQVLEISYEDDIAKEGYGRYGKLPYQMSLRECAQEVKERFYLESVRIYGDEDKAVETVAIIPGSGGSMIPAALKAKADVFITGDIKHHEGIDALSQGLCIIDASHYGLEKIFVPYIKEYLNRKLPDLAIQVVKQTEPFRVI